MTSNQQMKDLNNYIYPMGGAPIKWDKCQKCGDEFIVPSKYKWCKSCAIKTKMSTYRTGVNIK